MDNQDEYLRVGIGINNSTKKIGDMKIAGWDEKTPDITKDDMSKMIDAVLSTLQSLIHI